MTPNFISNVNASVALSCTCRGSGNLQEECERLEESFSHNPCLSKCATSAPSSVARPSGPRERKRVRAVYLLQTEQPLPQNRFTSPSLGLPSFSCSPSDLQASCSTRLGPRDTTPLSGCCPFLTSTLLYPRSQRYSISFLGSLKSQQLSASKLSSLFSSVEAIAVKMRLHSQLFSQDWSYSTLPVMERQVGPPLLHSSYLY